MCAAAIIFETVDFLRTKVLRDAAVMLQLY